jgi:hypothetical protein
MRAKLSIEAVNVKTDINILRKLADNFFSNMFPGLAFKLAALYFFIKIGDDTIITVFDIFPFVAAIITNTCLNYFS